MQLGNLQAICTYRAHPRHVNSICTHIQCVSTDAHTWMRLGCVLTSAMSYFLHSDRFAPVISFKHSWLLLPLFSKVFGRTASASYAFTVLQLFVACVHASCIDFRHPLQHDPTSVAFTGGIFLIEWLFSYLQNPSGSFIQSFVCKAPFTNTQTPTLALAN